MAFAPRERFVWRLRTRTLPLGERTLVMGILNVTPDSFSGDGLLRVLDGNSDGFAAGHNAPQRVVEAATRMLHAGADILDLGAESTRPDAQPLSAAEEQSRLLPALQAVLEACPEAILSVDTYHAETARAAARLGAEIINDVSGLQWDPAMASAAGATGCGLILMHTRGRSREWRHQPALPSGEVVPTVFAGLCERLALAEAAGLGSDRIVLDPGFGFGKLGEENFELLAGFGRLAQLGRPLLAGLSRKRFLAEAAARRKRELSQSEGETGGGSPSQSRLLPTVAGNIAAVLAGAHLVRVHDVEETRQAMAVADAVLAGIVPLPTA